MANKSSSGVISISTSISSSFEEATFKPFSKSKKIVFHVFLLNDFEF